MSEGARCTACLQDLHFHCAGITETGYRKLGDRKLTWRCVKCKQVGSLQTPSSPLLEPESVLLKEIRAIAQKLAPLESLKDEVSAIRTEFINFKSSFDNINKELKSFNSKIANVEERLLEVEKSQNLIDKIQTSQDKLEQESSSAEQWSRMNNVEIKGVPQSSNENLFDIIFKIGSQIQYPLNKSQINFVTRVPTRENNIPKPIIISFCNRYVKEDFVAAARYTTKKNPITTGHIGLTGTQKIFVNDHLTIENKSLLSKAKKAAAEMNFQFVWVKHAKIHVRKSDTSHVIIIKSEKDISKIVK
ncbi:hypothetical protein K1T71_001502 [Dendrolimus kikuchii]|uniref:Uncharacterized protein n=3 Tax=Dendrolimus kikuchii TaxID=765133 RepID=A0ACC1DJH7_9NEOP|nr:hypothetical protein K1T71_014961 [Dendrolimus kikuchii]KAJ0175129.1 hypothetical protein K1T71_009270 [Dendrolimus kikuchii]KAJ0183442.1 hypothetical protein K1T71_001418 [Dendrolimus kikuchii]KAJ0183526.1 hypothetical protein K1T71_001502 [Dendrolimus kikuchii]